MLVHGAEGLGTDKKLLSVLRESSPGGLPSNGSILRRKNFKAYT